ncbi:hypothetical protein [Paenibacillus sp. IHBB 10380]|uniref:hypothetical protein n=1 Tax=Paenibacillus sp. IHBB 10380 TaxID=1566358 RepID=UPI0005CFC7D0|nr:hypothetical protein [Paenibacillus sp. IHBB 10380]AJS59252.1 hypothetical protein UB51_13125 [Paenibacillus sp. IHBB 10380]
MNIGSMMRGLLGDSKVGDVNKLEMKTGQVVRGVVLSVSEDGQDAVLQIQGVKVQAKLETPLQQGQATLLQVQPPGEDGKMVMKPLSQSPYTAIPASSIADVLTSVGLSDTKANREMIQTLQASGVPITKENAVLFTGVLMAKPTAVPVEQWIQSAAIAFQRGLPMTGESVKGLQQAVFGPPLHQLLSGLGEQLAVLISNSLGTADAMNDGSTPTIVKPPSNVAAQVVAEPATVAVGKEGGTATAPANSTLQPLLAKLQDVLQQLRGTQLTASAPAPEAAPGSVPAAATPSGGNTPGAAPQPGMSAGVATPPASASAAAPSGIAAGTVPPTATAAPLGEGAAPSPASAPAAHEDTPWVGRMLKLLGAEHEQQAVRGGTNMPAQAPQGQAATAGNAQQGSATAGLASTPEAVPMQGQPATSSAQAQAGATAVSAQQTTTSTQVPVTGSTPAPVSASGNTAIPVTVQASPTTQGNQTPLTEVGMTGATPTNSVQEAINRMFTPLSSHGNPALGSETMMRPNAEALNVSQDTLKGLLLHVLERNDVPVALKEAAQQLVQHMTGQQLLLNTDRTAPFAQVTMFIPFTGQDGQETASVHIQSRRGKKGELDASNCRLWFDLDMKHLGTTLIDVQVVDKIVTLKVHNDNTWITSLIEDRREEISQAIESVGYQLLSLKAEPLPVPTIEQIDGKQSSITTEFTPPTYKGVDMKV